jgi:hypothetical protein
METYIFLALFALLLAVVLPALYSLTRRISARPGQLEIWRVMQRLGLRPAQAVEGEPRNMALAIRRCTLCPGIDACQQWLASGSREGLEHFCPNAAYLRKLERS